MGYDYPNTMTKNEKKIICFIINGERITIQRCLRGKWKEEKVIYKATTRFALHVSLQDNSLRTLKWEDHGDKWKIIRKDEIYS